MKFIELIPTVACNMHFREVRVQFENPRINFDAWLPN
jgi:hypothetical protein